MSFKYSFWNVNDECFNEENKPDKIDIDMHDAWGGCWRPDQYAG
jgi:hypothetical protein